MNLLAHAILTPPHSDLLLVGNLTADWIKGRARRDLPAAIQSGFELHRHIDTFTDTHPLTAASTALFEPKWARYAPILTDIFFDHLLITHWQKYSLQPFPAFVAHIYAILHAHRHLLPEHANYAICMMIADDWLTAYATPDGLRLTLSRVSSRLHSRGHSIELAPAVDDLPLLLPELQKNFALFFPQLQHHIATSTILRAA